MEALTNAFNEQKCSVTENRLIIAIDSADQNKLKYHRSLSFKWVILMNAT